jgi:hypothetical protein
VGKAPHPVRRSAPLCALLAPWASCVPVGSILLTSKKSRRRARRAARVLRAGEGDVVLVHPEREVPPGSRIG